MSTATESFAQLTLPWDAGSRPTGDIDQSDRFVQHSALPENQNSARINNTETLRRLFERTAKRPVELMITDNATSLFSMRRGTGDSLTIRLHHMFLHAGDNVLGELSRYIRNGRGKTPLFWMFVKQHTHLLRERPPRRMTLTPEGRHHGLLDIFDRLNHEYFNAELNCSITWGQRSGRRGRKSRILGSYSPHSDTIRLNPLLDNPRVPRYFVEYIVYHEMLHARLGIEERNGRRALHTPEFKRLERRFAHYERSIAWEKKGLI